MNKILFNGKNISEIVDLLESAHIETGLTATNHLSAVIDGERKTIFKGDSVVVDGDKFYISTMSL